MEKKQKTLAWVCGILVVGILIAGGIIWHMRSAPKQEWVPLTSIKSYEDFFEKDITEIELRKSVDVPEYVRVTDQEQIELWKAYFKGASFRYEKKSDQHMNGGGKMILFKTADGKTYGFFDASTQPDAFALELHEEIYTVKSDQPFPFDECYKVTAEKDGEQRHS